MDTTNSNYDALIEVDYPGSADIVYTRDADGRIASVSNGSTPIVSSIAYLPFGPATQYTFASGGQTLVKTYDANYRATDIAGSAINLHFALDQLGNINKEGDASGVPTPNESYQYDPLYRLKEVDNATGALWQKYSYSKTGDRLSKNTASITPVDVYHYATGTHHLSSITGADASARSFDANGNTTALQANGWTYGLGYNNTNRLSLIQQNGSTIMQYKLDGWGERVRKVPTSGSATEYVYDETGKLLYEYVGPTSNRSYIWADDTLIATVEADSSIHYIYTDHLGTPRAVTSTTSSTPIWTWPWLQNPFGEKPASGSGYALNVRFPGQYFDAETGLNYNYFRDYEPAAGRYVQSDPIGLEAGVNTYSYALDSPTTFLDSYGTNVTMTCRPLRNISIARHCGVCVWHWSNDCPPKKIIDRQFSTPGWSTGPTKISTDPTYVADRDSFNNPGGPNANYDIPVPESMTSKQFDASVINEGDHFHNPYYVPWGPNSNTAAAGIITNAGGAVPDVAGAIGEFWQPPPEPLAPRF